MFDIFINTIIVLTVISFNLAIYMWAIVMHKQMTVYNKQKEIIKPLLPEIQEFIQLAKHGMRNHINDFRKEIKENK